MPARKIIAVTLALAAFGLLLAAGCGSSSNTSAPALSPSDPSPALANGLIFTGTTIAGQRFDLATYRGKVVVVNFWASWCGWCAREMPDLVKFAASHPEVAVIGVDVNDKVADAQRFAVKYAISYPLVADEQGAIFGRFDSQGLPTTVFFDKDLNMVRKIVGYAQLADFEAGLGKAQ
jgi:cytochrome c biogenesis protein CcmG, thiol:disulfide interchange protein DsbE